MIRVAHRFKSERLGQRGDRFGSRAEVRKKRMQRPKGKDKPPGSAEFRKPSGDGIPWGSAGFTKLFPWILAKVRKNFRLLYNVSTGE